MRRALILAAAVTVLLAGCGEDEGGGRSTPPLTVSAAASLKTASPTTASDFPDAKAKFSFAGSDELAAQIEQGVKPDVFAAANTKLPDAALRQGPGREADRVRRQPARAGRAGRRLEGAQLARRPREARHHARDRLGGRPDRLLHAHRARQAPARAAQGDPGQRALARSPTSRGSSASSRRARSTPASSTSPTSAAPDGKLKAIELPADLQPAVAYGVAVVKGAKHPEQAKAFIDGLLEGDGAQALKDAGFEPPPAG